MNAQRFKQYLLSGVSYAIPFVASGGILIAVSIAFAPMTAQGPDFSHAPLLKLINDIGVAAFAFLIPVLSGYIAFGIADRPGIAPGFVGGYIAGSQKLCDFLSHQARGFIYSAARMLQLSERQCRDLFDTLCANLPEAVEVLLTQKAAA